ncbi:MAG: hypothetical protein ACFE8U_05805 [Candidatus Hermodarchaeota archaeon]
MNSTDQNIYCLDIISRLINNDVKGNIRAFRLKTDLDECTQLMSKDFNLPVEDVRKFLVSINANKNTIAHYILKVSNKIVAHGAVVKTQLDPTKGMLNAIHATEISYLKTLVNELSIHCKKEGIEKLYLKFTHLDNDSPRIEPYKELGFVYTGKIH